MPFASSLGQRILGQGRGQATAVVDWVGCHVPTGFLESCHGAGHVRGRGQQQPALLGVDASQPGAEHRILESIARGRLHHQAFSRYPHAGKKQGGAVGLGDAGGEQFTLSAGEQQPQARLLLQQRHCRGHSFGRIVQGHLAVALPHISGLERATKQQHTGKVLQGGICSQLWVAQLELAYQGVGQRLPALQQQHCQGGPAQPGCPAPAPG